MAESHVLATFDDIRNRVFEIRGQRVMFDYDLAELYGYEVKRLNEQVRRNIARFPDDFMFQLTWEEVPETIKSQFATLNESGNKRGMHMKKLPYAFTEQGVYMLATVLRGELAEQQSIFIMRAFREMRHYIEQHRQFVTHEEFERLSARVDKLAENFITDEDLKTFVIYRGQKFEADLAYIDIYRLARKSIHVVDNYVSAKTLELLSHKERGVRVTLFTQNLGSNDGRLTQSLVNDFNGEHGGLRIRDNKECHDRFIIIDYGLEAERAFLCGTSSKDAGRRVCAINELEQPTLLHPVLGRLLSRRPRVKLP